MTADGAPGLLAPLGAPVFRALWIAGVASSIGTAMQGVGATWLLVKIDPTPSGIALPQAAGSMPLFILGLPAGVLADIVDRRRLLIFANVWMAAAAAIMAVLAWIGLVSPFMLTSGTFAIGIGAALAAPAFQAIVPELASGPLLMPAVTLNSIGMNIARSIGPALGGFAAGAFGGAAVFAINAASTMAVVAALVAWRREAPAPRLPPETFSQRRGPASGISSSPRAFGAFSSAQRYSSSSQAPRGQCCR